NARLGNPSRAPAYTARDRLTLITCCDDRWNPPFEDSGGRGYYQRGRDGKLREVSTGEPVEFDQHGNHDD
ncbi:hypothetical protein ACGFX8_32635, partial [Streptomyces sp. NPDC048362]|uniref:hypothetical protein n=1 Tax=Streptomyces sp. NPDC048362 TaxID=3365539 RepID=UPI003717E50D